MQKHRTALLVLVSLAADQAVLEAIARAVDDPSAMALLAVVAIVVRRLSRRRPDAKGP